MSDLNFNIDIQDDNNNNNLPVSSNVNNNNNNNMNNTNHKPNNPKSNSNLNLNLNLNPNQIHSSNPTTTNNQPIIDNSNQVNKAINYIYQSNHPTICFLTILFKALTIIAFIILDWIIDTTALVYLLVILFSAFDFWLCKNISGRLLVGLRWWNEVKDNGQEVWIYESKHEIKESGSDSHIFWGLTYTAPLIWLFFTIWDIMRLKLIWASIAGACFVFNMINLMGFFRCSKRQQAKASAVSAQAALKMMSKGAEIAAEGYNK